MTEILTRIASMLALLIQQEMEKLGFKAWKIVLGLGLALVSVLLILVSIFFFGCSLYNQITIMCGPAVAAIAAGMFFLLLAALLMIVSKRLVKKC